MKVYEILLLYPCYQKISRNIQLLFFLFQSIIFFVQLNGTTTSSLPPEQEPLSIELGKGISALEAKYDEPSTYDVPSAEATITLG